MISDFIFDGEYASDYGLVLCDFSGSSGDTPISDVSFNTFKPASSDINYFTDATYSNPLSKTIQVLKMKDCDAVEMDSYDIERIAHWLCRTDGYHKFSWVDNSDDEVKYIYYNAQINMELVDINAKKYGLTLTINTNAPYGFSDYEYDFPQNTNSVIIKDESSGDGMSFLNMSIKVKSAGNLNVKCEYYGQTYTSIIKNCKVNEIITFTDNCVITSSDEDHDLMQDFNFVFPRIYNKYGKVENKVTINLSNESSLSYKIKRKVGL